MTTYRGSKSRGSLDRASVAERVKRLLQQIDPGDRTVNWHHEHDPKKLCSGVKRVFGGKVEQKVGPKPDGVWFDCGGEWLAWIASEMPDWLGDYTYRMSFDSSKVLHIDSPGMLDTFTQAYRASERAGAMGGDSYYIDWPAVAKKYKGIEICPYIWERRMTRHTFWYYGWDCASGCIWDPCIIRRLERIHE
jgi:hypothetical protein